MPKKELKIAEDSRYALVMTVARRARQLMKEAAAKGVNPCEVALVNIGNHKPVKLALEEVMQGKVGYKLREKGKAVPIESSPVPDAEALTEEAIASAEENPDAAG